MMREGAAGVTHLHECIPKLVASELPHRLAACGDGGGAHQSTQHGAHARGTACSQVVLHGVCHAQHPHRRVANDELRDGWRQTHVSEDGI
jgi:hypothetical protein